MVVNQVSGQIICTALGKGRVPDFRLFQRQRLPMLPQPLGLADKGYQGLTKLHANSGTPTKQPRQTKLDPCERQHNRLLARWRVVAEYVNRRLKLWRSLAERYRNRRRRLGWRFNRIAAFLNVELAQPA